MFALRIINKTRDNVNEPFKQQIETYELGLSYALIKKDTSKEFNEILTRSNVEDHTIVRAIVSGDNGLEFFIEDNTPLIQKSYYIVSCNGSTFEKL